MIFYDTEAFLKALLKSCNLSY